MFTSNFSASPRGPRSWRLALAMLAGLGLCIGLLQSFDSQTLRAADEPGAAKEVPETGKTEPFAAQEERVAGKFELHDLSLWMFDPGHPQANARNAFGTALPVTVTSVRSGPQTPAARRVAPIGLMTFHGEPTANLDIDLRTKAGGFLAHWPPGDHLPNRLRWSGNPSYDLVAKVDGSELMYVDGEHWINQARGLSGLYLKRGARSERFLAYDVELNLTMPIRLEGGPDKYRVINLTNAPLYDVLISRSTPEGRRVAWIDVLPKGDGVAPNAAPQPAPKPGLRPAQPGNQPPADLFSEPADDLKIQNPKLAIQVQQTERAKAAAVARDTDAKAKQVAEFTVAAPKPATVAAGGAGGGGGAGVGVAGGARLVGQVALAPAGNVAPANPAPGPVAAGQPKSAPKLFGGLPPGKLTTGVEVTLGPPLADKSAELSADTAAQLVKRLVQAGMNEDEARLFADHYGSVFFEGDALVVACRLEPAVLDEKLPVSVFPAPTKIVRVPIVVIRNADPQMGAQVDALIAQLGDPKFQVRETAQKRLLELGALAVPALNKAANGADLEIVIRAERILLQQNQTPGAGGNNRVMVNGVFMAAPQAVPVMINP